MQKLAIIGASYLQKPLAEKAKEMGLYTLCFAWEDGAVCKDLVDEFYPISITEKEQILKICQKEQIDGICTIASDTAAPTVAYVAEKMGLVGNSYDCACTANNKYLMRQAFMKANVPCPQYMMVDEQNINHCQLSTVNYPLIVKPSDRSGSLGVTKVENKEDLQSAIEKAINCSFKNQAMVEEFIDGREISVEFISYNGKHYPLTITDKVTTESPHFVELEHHQPADFSKEMYANIYGVTEQALNALDVTNGASHSEYKITKDGQIKIMEIGARMGGDFIGSNLVQLSTGYDFLKGVIDVALGQFTAPKKTLDMHSGVYFLCRETAYLQPIFSKTSSIPEIVQYEQTDSELRYVERSADRSGYIIYQANKKWIPNNKN
ncbi:MAG: ATP-grasp domain-containing protein [Paludibacteraceae bacterium]|nr:ATP-grasp domain-containing protein [Paludibacteraceae bacterium]